jgi:hypothetical protein
MILLLKRDGVISQVTHSMHSGQEAVASDNLASKYAFVYMDKCIIAS